MIRYRARMAVLLVAAGAASGAAAVTTNFSGTLDGSQTYTRPTAVNGTPPWGSSGTTFNFFSENFTPAGSGAFDVEVSGGTINDPVLYLYEGSFDPANTDANGIIANDDGGVGLLPRIDDVALTGNQNYVIVVTSFGPGDTGTLQFAIVGPFGVAVGAPPVPAAPALDATGAVDVAVRPSARGAAAVLDQLAVLGASGDMDEVLAVLAALSSDQELADAVEQTTPVLAGQAAQLSNLAGDALRSVIGQRLDALRTAAAAGSVRGRAAGSAGAAFSDRNAWIRPLGGWTEQDERGGVSGYDASTVGVALGADATLWNAWRVGVAGAYARGDADSDSAVARQNVDSRTWALQLYSTWSPDGRLAVNLQAGAGYSHYDSRRRIAFASVSRTAAGDYDGWHARASGEIERSYALGASTALVPYAGIDFSYVRVDGYTETGAGALNLAVNRDSDRKLVLRAGARLHRHITDSMLLMARAGVGYDLLTERSRLTSTFAGGGASFTTVGIEPDEVVYEGGLALRNSSGDLDLTAHYDIEARDDYTDQAVGLELRLRF